MDWLIRISSHSIHAGQTSKKPIINRLASLVLNPFCMTGQTSKNLIVNQLASLIQLQPVTSLKLTGQSFYYIHCKWAGQSFIVPIVDQLASLIITPLYMDWPD